jgi:AcrR family transcriptional regulator
MLSKPSGPKTASKRGPGRPRSDEARKAILDSTLSLLKEMGFNDLSIEGIATRAGVGKATVYRWWPNKAALVIDAFLVVVEPELRFPKGDSARDTIRQQMRRLTRLMRGELGTVLATIVGAGQSQPEMLEAVRKNWVEPRRKEARALVQKAQKSGEIRDDIPADTILDILYGSLYYRLLIGHAVTDGALVDAVFEIASSGIQRATRHPETGSQK